MNTVLIDFFSKHHNKGKINKYWCLLFNKTNNFLIDTDLHKI